MLEGEGSKACFRSEGDDYTKVLRTTTSRSQHGSSEEGGAFLLPMDCRRSADWLS